MTEPLILAVVGHTNTGKTSLLRTLTRDRGFGEVSHRPSTTRHVEGARLSVDGEALLELYDTPGLEDAIALLDYLDALERPGERLDGPERMARLLDSNEARGRFEQEAKVVRQLLASDAGLYVIDAREPVLAKYRDELAVLAGCGRPLLPVLNFVASPQHREEEWRAALARLGLHALVRFDSVAPPLDGEQRLYESLALLLERARPQLDRLIADHETQAAARLRAGQRLIAELLVDVAACRRLVPGGESAVQEATRDLHQQVRKREQACVEALLRLYAFARDDARAADLPLLDDGRPAWAAEPFECLLFDVAGLTLAVPLVCLGSIYPLENQELTPLFGQPDWFLGILPSQAGNLKVLDTARWVMPERYRDDYRDGLKYVISVQGYEWGLAVHQVSRSIRLDPAEVKWRSQRSQRPWLAGTVIEHMCALLDVAALAELIASGAVKRLHGDH
nr:DUF3482 domain-containing protein [Pseudomonas aeruginosa]